MTEKLLACPFCGGDAVLATRDGWHVATCNDAVCPGYQCMYTHSEAKGAIAAWNTRAPVSNFALVAITTAYEQGVGKGREYFHTKRAIANPYAVDDVYRTYGAWALGFDEGKSQAERAAQQPGAQVENTGSKAWKLRKALQRAHDWMDSQANAAMYKVSFTELAQERDAIAEAVK